MPQVSVRELTVEFDEFVHANVPGHIMHKVTAETDGLRPLDHRDITVSDGVNLPPNINTLKIRIDFSDVSFSLMDRHQPENEVGILHCPHTDLVSRHCLRDAWNYQQAGMKDRLAKEDTYMGSEVNRKMANILPGVIRDTQEGRSMAVILRKLATTI